MGQRHHPKIKLGALDCAQRPDWRPAAALTLLLLGCDAIPTDQRCHDLMTQELVAKYHAIGEERFNEELFASLPTGYTQEQYLLAKRSLRARAAAELKESLRSKYPEDSAMWRFDPIADSADLEPVPPPTPSESAWYAENCWQGKAR